MKHVMQIVVLAFLLPLLAGTCRGQSSTAPSIDPQAEKIMRQLNTQKIDAYQCQHGEQQEDRL